MATQNRTNTAVGARFAVGIWLPDTPHTTTATNTATPTAPQTGSSIRGRPNSRRGRERSRRGVDHSLARATNDSTSTAPAAHANSHVGTGR